MKSNSVKQYEELIKSLESLNRDYKKMLSSKEYRLGSVLIRTIKCIFTLNFKSILGYLRTIRSEKKTRKLYRITREAKQHSKNYYLNEKVAVYTSIFGSYDRLNEPVFKPDNIDYYIVTDQDVDDNSLWKKIDYDKKLVEGMSNAEKNRFFKMHPDVLFSDYKYSIYVDGNITVVSDLSYMINRLKECGIGLHYHSQRECAYDELEATIINYKAKKEDVDSYIEYLQKQGFPKKYGLLECNVIAREHNNPICKSVMNEWWKQYSEHIKRDQVSLPYCLYKNNILVDDVAVLGENVYECDAIRVSRHSN